MSPSLTILFAGSGAFGLPTLAALRDAGHTIGQVISQPDRPAGRGRILTPTPIASFAIEHHLPLVRTTDINTLDLPQADVLIVIAFGQKIAPAVVNHCRLGSINLHSSRLPKFRGAAPINWAILAGETTTGNSIIRLADAMDAGAILAQSEVMIGETETAGELHDRLSQDGAPLMLATLQRLADGTAVEASQNGLVASKAPKLSRELAVLNWSRSPFTLARQINGLSPWPGCRVRLIDADGKERSRLTLLRAAAAADLSEGVTPARIVGDRVGGVRILDVQPDGKRPMTLPAFRNGGGWRDGWTVESIL